MRAASAKPADMPNDDAGSLPSEGELQKQLADLPADQLRSLLGTETPEGEALLSGEGLVPAAKEEPKPDEPTDEDPKPEGDEGPRRRVRPRTDLDHQVLDLYKSEGFKGSFQDAVDVIYGRRQQKDTGTEQAKEEGKSPPPQKPAEPEAEIDAQVEALTREMADLEKQIEEAAEELKTSDALRFQRELDRKERQVERLKDRKDQSIAQRQSEVRNAFQEKAVAAKTEALERYPVLADKNAVERKQFDAFLEQAQDDAELAPIFHSPRWPLILAEEFARRSSLTAAKKAAGKQTFDTPTQTRATQAKVLTSGDAPPASNAAPNERELRELLPKLTPQQLRELMGTTGQ
jgi:hypothetical protein